VGIGVLQPMKSWQTRSRDEATGSTSEKIIRRTEYSTWSLRLPGRSMSRLSQTAYWTKVAVTVDEVADTPPEPQSARWCVDNIMPSDCVQMSQPLGLGKQLLVLLFNSSPASARRACEA
jgi:hypothetical protein